MFRSFSSAFQRVSVCFGPGENDDSRSFKRMSVTGLATRGGGCELMCWLLKSAHGCFGLLQPVSQAHEKRLLDERQSEGRDERQTKEVFTHEVVLQLVPVCLPLLPPPCWFSPCAAFSLRFIPNPDRACKGVHGCKSIPVREIKGNDAS